MKKGKLIVFEGVEGCGKSTQLNKCHEMLKNLGLPVLKTRQPGGTQLGEKLREILLNGSVIAPMAELLLYAADRAQHISQEILPALNAGYIVLCDRFSESTIAYQDYGRGLNSLEVWQIDNFASDGLESDLTIIFDLDPAIGLARKRGQALDKLERESLAFHERVLELMAIGFV